MKSIPAKYRRAVYIGSVLLLAALFLTGIFTPEQVESWMTAVVAAAAIVANTLAAFNVTPDKSDEESAEG